MRQRYLAIGGLRYTQLAGFDSHAQRRAIAQWQYGGKPYGFCVHCQHHERLYLLRSTGEGAALECVDEASCERRLRLARHIRNFCERRSA